MKPIWTLDEVFAGVAEAADPGNWTAVIPAAGRGSRLGYHLPKILFPVLGRPIAAWIIESLKRLVGHYVFVLAPDAVEVVRPCLQEQLLENFAITVQPQPRGMADAVFCARHSVATPNVLVVWGDQVTLSARTVEACIRLHEHRDNASLTLPTILKREPYIHFERDRDQRITRVLEAREQPIPGPVGENDCGLFLFSAATLFESLERALLGNQETGRTTGELNLLPLIPRFERGPGSLVTVRIESEEETLGINTQEDVSKASEVLARRLSGSG